MVKALRLLALLVLLAGLAWLWRDRLPFALPALASVPGLVSASAPEAPLYRWRDAQGRINYGNTAPAGLKAERVSAGSMSVVPAHKAPAPATARPEQSGARTIQEMALERAIDQAR